MYKANIITALSSLASIYALMRYQTGIEAIRHLNAPNNGQRGYTINWEIVDMVRKGLGLEVFYSQLENSNVRLEVCLDFLYKLPERCPSEVEPDEWDILDRPYEAVILDSCLPLLSLSKLSNVQQIIASLKQLDFFPDLYSPTGMIEMARKIQNLQQYDSVFSEDIYQQLVANKQASPTIRFDQRWSLVNMKHAFGEAPVIHGETNIVSLTSSPSHKTMITIYNECFHDDIIRSFRFAHTFRDDLLGNYSNLAYKSALKIAYGCLEHLDYILQYELMYGRWGNETIDDYNEHNHFESTSKILPESSVMDALEEIIFMAANSYGEIFDDPSDEAFDRALKVVMDMNLLNFSQNNRVRGYNNFHKEILEAIRFRAKKIFNLEISQSYNESNLPGQMINFIYRNHLLIPCEKIRQSFDGRMLFFSQFLFKQNTLDPSKREPYHSRLTSNLMIQIISTAHKICLDHITSDGPQLTLTMQDDTSINSRPLFHGTFHDKNQ